MGTQLEGAEPMVDTSGLPACSSPRWPWSTETLLAETTIQLDMLLGVGVDVVHLPRMAALISRRGYDRVASRILSGAELSDSNSSKQDPVKFLAVRFSVKEAAYKALYPVHRPTWKELTYRSPGRTSGLQKPTLERTSGLPDHGPKCHLHVSASHDGDYVFTTVVAESQDLS